MRTDVGFKWRVNLEAIESSLACLMGFPTQFPTEQYNGKTLFIGGGRSEYIQLVFTLFGIFHFFILWNQVASIDTFCFGMTAIEIFKNIEKLAGAVGVGITYNNWWK